MHQQEREHPGPVGAPGGLLGSRRPLLAGREVAVVEPARQFAAHALGGRRRQDYFVFRCHLDSHGGGTAAEASRMRSGPQRTQRGNSLVERRVGREQAKEFSTVAGIDAECLHLRRHRFAMAHLQGFEGADHIGGARQSRRRRDRHEIPAGVSTS